MNVGVQIAARRRFQQPPHEIGREMCPPTVRVVINDA